MKDLNRKVEKFVKEKNNSATKKNVDSALTPHVIYGVSSAPKTFAKISNNLSTRSFSMTVSFFKPRFEKVAPKDIAIRHEDKKMNMIAASPESFRSSIKRDPILQNNEEAGHEYRSTVKFTPLSARTTIFTEEPVYSKKIVGEYNHVYNARSLSPKIESLRTTIKKRSDSPDEPRRAKKAVNSAYIKSFNPITEGDVSGVVIRKERLAPEISEATKKLNDRNHVLPAERGNSTKGKVFWQSNSIFSSENTPADIEAQKSPLGARLGSPKIKPEDSIRGVMQYDNAPNFRDQGVSDKCNNQPMSSLMRASEV